MRSLAPLSLLALSLSAPAPEAQAVEIQKVLASQGGASDLFGRAVAASGARALVGASHEGGGGAAYVYDRQPDGSWLETFRMTASDGVQGDTFGNAVALSGDRAIVGALSDDGLAGIDQGAAYVFERQVDGLWLEVDKLTPTLPAVGEQFGHAVALDGDYAAVSAYKNDDIDTLAGKVWLFERQAGGTWVEVDALTASDETESDHFGWSLALSGETLLVGADTQAVASGSAHGAVYVFGRVGGAWNETQKLLGNDTDSLDHFGWSVAIDGDLAVVGAHNTELGTDPFNFDSGAAYVFERVGGNWGQIERLAASDAEASDELGYSVGVSGQRVLVGARDEDEGGSNAGAAYLYEREGNAWVETKLTASDAASSDLFGYSVAMAGDIALVGARNDDDQGSSSGSAYLFDAEPLSAAGGVISLAAGGTQVLELDAGHLHAGEIYVLLGSVSGTSPGLPLAPGLTVPLNPDFYFNVTLLSPNKPPLVNSVAGLNGVGHSGAAFSLAAGANPGLAGLTLHHAFVTLDAALVPNFASNAVALQLVP